MSGLSLASHPRLAGAGRHGRRKPGLFARFSCACPACPPLWGFRLLCFMPVAPAATGSRAHTFCLPTRCGVGALVFARGWQFGLVVGVFARGWLGFGVCAFWVCSRGCLRACLCALAWGWWGVVCPAAPSRSLPSGGVGFWCSRAACGRLWRVRCSLGCGGNGNGAGQRLSRPIQCGVGCPRCVSVERERGLWAPARSGELNPSLVLAYVETGSRPVGAEQGGGASGRTVRSGWGRWFQFWW